MGNIKNEKMELEEMMSDIKQMSQIEKAKLQGVIAGMQMAKESKTEKATA